MTELGKILREFAEERRVLMENAKAAALRRLRGSDWHFVGRGIEIVAIDETGERNDDLGGPEYIETKHLTQKILRETAGHWLKHYSPNRSGHELAKLGLAYGLDVYDSFADYMAAMRGDWLDHDIWDDWAEAEIPIELLKEAA